jgi:hypothetical protein
MKILTQAVIRDYWFIALPLLLLLLLLLLRLLITAVTNIVL